MSSQDTSKTCPKCETVFSLQDFLTHRSLEPVGLSSDYDNPDDYYLHFCHAVPECMTTLLVPMEFFQTVIHERIPEDRQHGKPSCPRHCTTIADLRTCGCQCYQAPYRRFMLALMKAREAVATH